MVKANIAPATMNVAGAILAMTMSNVILLVVIVTESLAKTKKTLVEATRRGGEITFQSVIHPMTLVKATETMTSDTQTLVLGTRKGVNGPWSMLSIAKHMRTAVLRLVSGILSAVIVILCMFTIPPTILGVRRLLY